MRNRWLFRPSLTSSTIRTDWLSRRMSRKSRRKLRRSARMPAMRHQKRRAHWAHCSSLSDMTWTNQLSLCR